LALSRESKEAIVEDYGAKMARAQVMVWSHYRGIAAGQTSGLRRQLKANSAELVVVKNTLIRRALVDANLPVDDGMMVGPCAVAFIYDDIATATKAVVDFSRASGDLFQIAGGIVGGKLASQDQVRSLVDLPSREQLLAQVLGGIQAPMTGLVTTLSAVIRGVMTVLNERAKQLEGAS
jgi:large subunit ribosomal protein L10